MKHFDKFTDGKFDGSQWSAPRLNTVEEVERALDEFQLVGRTIRSIQIVGISFAHRMDEIDEYAHQLIQQLPEAQKQGKEGFDDLEPEMEMEQYLELDEPLLIHFEDGDTFEIDTPWEDIWYMSMNRIPPGIKSCFGQPNVDAEIMFSPCLWRKISRVQVYPGKEGAGALTLWLEGGIGLTVFPWEDFCEVYCIDEQRKPLKLKVHQLRRALYNWEDLHEDQITGFSAGTSTIFFNRKGRERVGNPHVCFIPEGTDSMLSIHEDDFTGLAWALSMVLGEQYDIYGEDLELNFHQWNQFLKEAEKILAYTSYRKLYKYLMTLKKRGSSEPVLKWYVDHCGQEYWENREVFRQQINNLKRWSEEILKPDGKMVVMGS